MSKELTCFVIMPISDQEGYDIGHFGRVYEHLIKPACIQAGFTPMRADEQSKTNYIVIDIIKKILESDMVVCDLSAKNPNVLYELGIRQAFNKRALLIKDKKTTKIFDIQGLRYIDYNEDLRIDSVQSRVLEISKGIKETYEASESEINSLIQLLSIKPAQLKDTVELSDDTSVILKAINSINDRLSFIEGRTKPIISLNTDEEIKSYSINDEVISLGDRIFIDGKDNGTLVDVHPDGVILKQSDNKVKKIGIGLPIFKKVSKYPF